MRSWNQNELLATDPRDVSEENRGYDIESTNGQNGRLRFLEVKGRIVGADTVTITRNEVVTGINCRENYYLAIVQINEDESVHEPVYVSEPFEREPDFEAASVNYKIKKLLKKRWGTRMKRSKPNYFDEISLNARRRWHQLEADPELAGPWRQLFSQVQSPRHVLSELLQNADDAGAQRVKVRIEKGYFLFEHDGQDFTSEEFASLCRFGYSNKRNLHTIGFRGIGFKSTFSLGKNVDVLTPSLAVRFEKHRFTRPRWIESAPDVGARTIIRVKIEDDRRQKELEKNFKDWINSPASLLFFTKCLQP